MLTRSKVPVYSDRINFLLAVCGQEIPMKTKIEVLQNIRCKFGLTSKPSLKRALSVSAMVTRDINVSLQQESDEPTVMRIKEILLNFFTYAHEVEKSSKNVEKDLKSDPFLNLLEDVYNELGSTVSEMNKIIKVLDDTWLFGYGSISFDILKYRSVIDFLEVLSISEKVLGPDFSNTIDFMKSLLPFLKKLHYAYFSGEESESE